MAGLDWVSMNEKAARILAWLTASVALASVVVGVVNLTLPGRHDELHNSHLYAVGGALLGLGVCVVHGAGLKALGALRDTPSKLPVVWWLVSVVLTVFSAFGFLIAGLGRMAWG